MKIAFSFGQIKCLFDIFSLLDLFLLLLSNLLRNLPPDPLCLFFDSSSRHPHLGTGVGDDDRPHLRREQQDEAGQDDKLQGEDAPVLLHGHADLHPLGDVGQGGGHLRAIDGHELAPERNGFFFQLCRPILLESCPNTETSSLPNISPQSPQKIFFLLPKNFVPSSIEVSFPFLTCSC